MGQVKKLLMDFEEKVSIIDNILMLLSSDKFEEICEPQLISDLHFIRNMIGALDSSSMSTINLISNVITDDFYIIYSELEKMSEDIEFEGGIIENREKLALKKVINNLWNKVTRIKKLLQDYAINKTTVYNSEDYYKNQISEIQRQKEELEKALNKIQHEKRNIQGKSQAERELQEKKIQEKEIQLQIANKQIHNYKIELEEKKKQSTIQG